MTHTAHYIVQSRVYLRDGIAVYIAIVRRRPSDDMTRRIGYNMTHTEQCTVQSIPERWYSCIYSYS